MRRITPGVSKASCLSGWAGCRRAGTAGPTVDSELQLLRSQQRLLRAALQKERAAEQQRAAAMRELLRLARSPPALLAAAQQAAEPQDPTGQQVSPPALPTTPAALWRAAHGKDKAAPVPFASLPKEVKAFVKLSAARNAAVVTVATAAMAVDMDVPAATLATAGVHTCRGASSAPQLLTKLAARGITPRDVRSVVTAAPLAIDDDALGRLARRRRLSPSVLEEGGCRARAEAASRGAAARELWLGMNEALLAGATSESDAVDVRLAVAKLVNTGAPRRR